MSQWYEITDADDISISDDREDLHILFDSNDFGNVYVSVPIEIIHIVIKDWLKEQEDK